MDREDSMAGSKGMFQGVRDRARLMASRSNWRVVYPNDQMIAGSSWALC